MTQISWNSGASGAWSTAANWAGGIIPNSTTVDVTIVAAGAYTVTLASATTESVHSVAIDNSTTNFDLLGTINLGGTLANFTFDGGTFTLGSTGTVSGGTLDIDTGTLLNQGGLIATSDFILGGGASIALNGHNLTLTSAALAGVIYGNGSVGNTLVTNGNVTAEGGTLNGVTDAGGFSVYENSLNITGGIDFVGSTPAAVNVTGGVISGFAPANLNIYDATSLANVAFDLADTGYNTYAYGGLNLIDTSGGNETLTLASNASINDIGNYNGYAENASVNLQGAETLVNLGTISAEQSPGFGLEIDDNGAGEFINKGLISISNGDTLTIETSQFVNSGSIIVGDSTSSGTLILDTNLTTAQLAQSKITGGGVVMLSGDLNNAGSTLNLALGLSGIVSGGTIAGAITSDGGTLSGVTDEGGFGVYSSSLNITGGIKFAGSSPVSVYVSGYEGYSGYNYYAIPSNLNIYDATSLSNVVFDLAETGTAGTKNGLNLINTSGGNETLTLTSNASINDTGNSVAALYIESASINLQGAETLVNLGTISAGQSSGAGLVIDDNGFGNFINEGLITINNGDMLTIETSQFANSGSIKITAGASLVADGGTFVDTGVIEGIGAGIASVSISSGFTYLAGTALSGGIYEAMTGDTLALNLNGSSFTIDDATIILSGLGSDIDLYNNSTSAYAPFESELATIGTGGMLEALGGRGYTTSNNIVLAGGTLNLGGGTFTAATLKLTSAASRIFGTGVVTDAI